MGKEQDSSTNYWSIHNSAKANETVCIFCAIYFRHWTPEFYPIYWVIMWSSSGCIIVQNLRLIHPCVLKVMLSNLSDRRTNRKKHHVPRSPNTDVQRCFWKCPLKMPVSLFRPPCVKTLHYFDADIVAALAAINIVGYSIPRNWSIKTFLCLLTEIT